MPNQRQAAVTRQTEEPAPSSREGTGPPITETLLVVVHPGSACGSADFNLGATTAAHRRRTLIADLDAWSGPLLVIEGSLGLYRSMALAVDAALHRARSAKLLAGRIWGCDDVPPHQDDAVRSAAQLYQLSPRRWRISVTGAWTDGDGGGGCVGDVATTFRSLGFTVEIRPSALRLE